jgi:hypothetical protein
VKIPQRGHASAPGPVSSIFKETEPVASLSFFVSYVSGYSFSFPRFRMTSLKEMSTRPLEVGQWREEWARENRWEGNGTRREEDQDWRRDEGTEEGI